MAEGDIVSEEKGEGDSAGELSRTMPVARTKEQDGAETGRGTGKLTAKEPARGGGEGELQADNANESD